MSAYRYHNSTLEYSWSYKSLLPLIPEIAYSVMKSDGISFCEDVVLDSFTKASMDEDNNLDQIFEVWIILLVILILYNITKMHTNTTVTLNPKFILLLCAVFLYVCIFINYFKILNLNNKDPKIFAFHTFDRKYCLHPC